MYRNKTVYRKKIMVFSCAVFLMLFGLMGRIVYLMVVRADYYEELAEELHQRERDIKAARGKILDRNGVVLADNKTVCTISVIHNQIEDAEEVIRVLVQELDMEEAEVRKRVGKVSSIERIKTNVDKETGDKIRDYQLAGVKIDEDYKRYYPYDALASKVLGFTGGDNQGIIGLEVKYEEYLKGTNGQILTYTDARGIEIEDAGETRKEPVSGNDLHISLDYNIQNYIEQEAMRAMESYGADAVSLLVMNPNNGEIYGMANVPEFDLNHPFEIDGTYESDQNKLNQMWRNSCINDTYEPGSTFKIITSAAALESGNVSVEDHFHCPGYRIVEDRRIRCHKTQGHGSESFEEGIMNSCNPVFMDIGLRMGSSVFYEYFQKFGLLDKTGIDLPGEASTIMHQQKNIGQVELATISFGQSFQITPIQLATTVSAIINGGNRVTPHFAMYVTDENGDKTKDFSYPVKADVVSEDTVKTMRTLLEKVVSEGTGNKAAIEGYAIGGKTATSQTLPRSANKYIASFIGFAPADNPQVIAMVIIHDPQGVYYGGTIAAPVIKNVFANILPYLGIESRLDK